MATAVIDLVAEAVAALEALVAADPACAERDELAGLVKCVRRVRGFADAYDVQLARRGRELNQRDRPQPAPGTPPPDPGRDEAGVISMLLTSGHQSGKEAQATAGRATACALLPGFEDALAAGQISAAHVDVVAKLLRHLDEVERVELRDRAEELLRIARLEFAEGFHKTVRRIVDEVRARHRPNSAVEELEQQQAASRIVSWVDRATGMNKTLIELDPLRHQEWWRMFQAQLARLKAEPGSRDKTYDQLKVEAFLAGFQPPGATPTGNNGRRVPKALVVVDYQTVIAGPHVATIAELSNGQPLPVSTIRRLLCDADIVPVFLGTDGQPLDVGAASRLATPAQRDALGAIYTGCVELGCPVGIDDCTMHHTKEWQHHHTTNIADLAPLCDRGHHRVHEGGWRLEINDNHHTITWYRPDGTIDYHGPAPNRRLP